MGLGVDVIIPTAICEGVARNINGLVAPAIPYGYKSQPRTGGGQAFPGTISLDLHTLTLVVRDVIIGLGRSGMRLAQLAAITRHFGELAGATPRD